MQSLFSWESQAVSNEQICGTRADKEMFSDLATIKAIQESGIAITKKNCHIVVDQYMGYKELQFHGAKIDFVEPMYKKFSKWKSNGKPVTFIRQDNTLKNKVLMKITTHSGNEA